MRDIFYRKAKTVYFSTEGNNILLEFLFEKSCDVKIEQKNAFFVRNFTKLCENMRKFVNYGKTFKLCDFMRKLSNYAISHKCIIHGALRM